MVSDASDQILVVESQVPSISSAKVPMLSVIDSVSGRLVAKFISNKPKPPSPIAGDFIVCEKPVVISEALANKVDCAVNGKVSSETDDDISDDNGDCGSRCRSRSPLNGYDLLIFGKVSTKQATVVHEVLDVFCMASGQSANISESRIYFSNSVSRVMKSRLQQLLGVAVTSDLGRYLGVLLLHGCTSIAHYKHIVSSVEARLANWHSKFLSLAGKEVLIKSSISSLPIYSM
ncbi:hypothetical protein K2173_016304 [Erythroxylum novogranatense]|uniref:Uncharacterized protein n=1 Tax=Erythroxylum novogranatense TaxID=1862640 RepID=A0AAV8SG30_9ROSI|nr:hypothetical protein K2173_016304 [Erythroxylum novogranatense]